MGLAMGLLPYVTDGFGIRKSENIPLVLDFVLVEFLGVGLVQCEVNR